MVTLDRNYLGQGNVDKFDAIVYKVRYFRSNDVSIFYIFFMSACWMKIRKRVNLIQITNYLFQSSLLVRLFLRRGAHIKNMLCTQWKPQDWIWNQDLSIQNVCQLIFTIGPCILDMMQIFWPPMGLISGTVYILG